MSFALPTAFLLAGLALPIVGFYILKVRLRRFPVSTNLFWRQIYDEKPPRSIWQNFRHLLSLLAQLAILLLLVLAVADPYLPWNATQARRIVLVVDPSASMQATDIGPTRFDAAKSHAQRLLGGLREQDQLAIVLAGKSPEVVIGMSGHIPTLRRAIEGLQVTDRTTSLQPAIELGRKLIGRHPQGQIIVLTDGCEETAQDESESVADPAAAIGAAPPLPEASLSIDPVEEDETEIAIAWEIFATEANNVGITQFQARRSLGDPLGYEILTSVFNASSEAIRVRLEITLDDQPIDILPLRLQPGEKWRRSLEKTSLEGGQLVATLSKIEPLADADEAANPGRRGKGGPLNQLTVDDTAWAYLAPCKTQRVLLVTEGNFFLEKVFQATPLVQLQTIAELPEAWPTDTLIVLHRQVPSVIPPGPVFVIDPADDCDLWQVEGTVDHPIITEQAIDSPLMTHLRLDNVLVPQAPKLTFANPATVLAGTITGESIYAQVKRPDGPCLVLCVNLEQSDLTFRTVFPIMVSNALNELSSGGSTLQPAIGTDDLITFTPPEDTDTPGQTILISPGGERTELDWSLPESDPADDRPAPVLVAATPAGHPLGPFPQVGMWQIAKVANDPDSETEVLRHVSVNLANERETDLRPLAERATTSTQGTSLAGGWNRPLWFYLALMVCLFSAAEWGLYQRRVIT